MQRGEADEGPNIGAVALNSIQYHIVFPQCGDCFPSPLGMEIQCIRPMFNMLQVINLIEEMTDCMGMLVFQGNAGSFLERHGKETIHAPVGCRSNKIRVDEVGFAKSQTEEIAKRAFDRWESLIIPIHT
ncbi:hypothetical protein SDC9_92875 [bioreactor metagenome]|uniref:Uncharacterized protein n=1 Tax=bioreactor metagenome TaxID=1076179 RepID=A0A644ZZH4_9ZZZZ